MQSALDSVKSICLTTDTWTAQSTTQSFVSLTAHWINNDFVRKSAVLHCELFEGSHTGVRLVQALTDMLRNWNIEGQKVHVVLCDSAANMVKALRDAS